MSTQCSVSSLRPLKRRRSSEGAMVEIPMEDDVQDESPRALTQCFATTRLFNAMKSLLISCYVTGLLSSKRFDKTGLRKYFTVTFIYSSTILLLLTAHAIRYLSMFKENNNFGPVFFTKVAYVSWTLEALGHFASFYVASCAYERLPKFFIEWEKIRKDCPQSHASIVKLTNICTAVVWILVVFFTGFSSYLMIFTDSLNMLLTPLNKEHPYASVMSVFNIIIEVYLNFAWIAPSALMFLFCRILAIEFNRIKQRINTLDRKGRLMLFRDLEGIRQHHEKLCVLVGYADNLFSMQIIGSFAGSVFMTCLITYILIVGNLGGVLIVTQTVHLMTAVVKVLIDCISGAMINEAVSVHKLLSNIQRCERLIAKRLLVTPFNNTSLLLAHVVSNKLPLKHVRIGISQQW